MTIKNSKYFIKVPFNENLMHICNSDNRVSFKGRVYYANYTARDYAPKYREIIHQLKHTVANNELSHYIYLDQ